MVLRDVRVLLEKLNPTCTALVEQAVALCVTKQHYEVRFEHVLAAALDAGVSNDIGAIGRNLSLDTASLRRTLEGEIDSLASGNTGKPVFCPGLLDALEEAWVLSTLQWKLAAIRSAALLAAGLRQSKAGRSDWPRFFESLTIDTLLSDLDRLCLSSGEGESFGVPGDSGGRSTGGPLEQFCTDFTELARNGGIDTILGRNNEIRQVLDILARRRKNNPILVGEAGVGKTAVVEGLALRIAQGDVPQNMLGASVYGLDLGLLQAGAGVKGEFEKRLKGVIEAAVDAGERAILFIDEAHTLIGAGGTAGQNDAANLLKPVLARGELKTIAATTWAEYRRYFEKDSALARRFQPVAVGEPDNERCRLMLRGIAGAYEKFHGVTITDEAIGAAIELSRRFIAGRQLPDKAVDVLDTAATRVRLSHGVKPAVLDSAERELSGCETALQRLRRDRDAGVSIDAQSYAACERRREKARGVIQQESDRWEREKELVGEILELRHKQASRKGQDGNELREQLLVLNSRLRNEQGETPVVFPEVTARVCGQVVSDWTGIPAGALMRDEAQVLLELEQRLGERLVGQDAALAEICSTVRSAKSGMRSPDAPLGVFLFAGPSGVGKTECALALADIVFGGEQFLTVINMSEYREQHTVSQLKGAPPGYAGFGEGGVLTDAVRQTPYSVVLLDEVEKAHRDVLSLFYQVFDKGVMRDGEGREVDFRNTLIIMTSNLGSEVVAQLCRTGEGDAFTDLAAAIRPALLSFFQPALLGRCRVIPFRPLDRLSLSSVIRFKTDRITERIRAVHGLICTFSEGAIDGISRRCTVHESGARDIDTVLEQQVLPGVSRNLLSRLDPGVPEEPGALEVDCDAKGMFVVQAVLHAVVAVP